MQDDVRGFLTPVGNTGRQNEDREVHLPFLTFQKAKRKSLVEQSP